MWKKDKRYHVSEKPFDENLAESRKIWELKKDAHYSYALFAVHTSIIEKGWFDAKFIKRLRHNKWVATPGFFQSDLTRNVKLDH